jgi:hypothetical protein
MSDAFKCVHKWFQTNLLTINLNKTHCVQFKTKNKSITDLNIVCNNRQITTLSNIKFLGYKYKWYNELEWSCRINYSEIELCMIYHEECEALHASQYLEINLLLLFQYCNELWFTLLGKFTSKFKSIYNAKEDN